MSNAKEIALKILESEHIGVMVTNQSGRPVAKYMTFVNDGFDLYTLVPTEALESQKTENNDTHILLGYEGENVFETFIEYEGKISKAFDEQIQNRLETIYSNSQKKSHTLLKITPSKIRIMNKAGENQEEVIL